MTDGMKKKKIERKEKTMDGVFCEGCGARIRSKEELEEIEYVLTKRKTELFFHRGCAGLVWHGVNANRENN